MSKKSEAMCEEVVQAFLQALGQKENELKEHNQRVAQLAVLLGQGMGLTGLELVDLRWGALLHDIGKLSIPDHILNKTGELTEEEYEVIKTHTLLGAAILRHMSFLKRAYVVAESHHERWDGMGYPYGLKGTEIPLLARISAVAGAYDALTNNRSYRSAWPKAKALEYICERAGKVYDPQVVDVFLSII